MLTGRRPRTTGDFRFGESHQSHFAPRSSPRTVFRCGEPRISLASVGPPTAHPCADGRTPGSLPGPLTEPCFGCTHPRLDRRGERTKARVKERTEKPRCVRQLLINVLGNRRDVRSVLIDQWLAHYDKSASTKDVPFATWSVPPRSLYFENTFSVDSFSTA